MERTQDWRLRLLKRRRAVRPLSKGFSVFEAAVIFLLRGQQLGNDSCALLPLETTTNRKKK